MPLPAEQQASLEQTVEALDGSLDSSEEIRNLIKVWPEFCAELLKEVESLAETREAEEAEEAEEADDGE